VSVALVIQPRSTGARPHSGPQIAERLIDLQFLKFCHDICCCGRSLHLTVNVDNLPVFSNIESPALGDLSSLMNHAVRFGYFLSGIAEDGIIRV
jgi:hypothetical protein